MTFGQPEAFSRLVNGVSSDLPQGLTNLGLEGDVMAYTRAIADQVGRPIVHPGMPVGEVIDLANAHAPLFARSDAAKDIEMPSPPLAPGRITALTAVRFGGPRPPRADRHRHVG